MAVVSGIVNVFKVAELRKRLLFTLGLLAVYRLGIFVTTPGVNRQAMKALTNSGTLFGMFNFFSGGAFEQLSIFALGIMPYVSASIILQLLTVVVPTLEALQKEGELGRRKITQYTRYLTVALAGIQGYGIAQHLENQTAQVGDRMAAVVAAPGWGFRLMTMVSLAAGTAFIMWLGEQITERGIGNGISLIIFAGIVARMPASASSLFPGIGAGEERGPMRLLILAAIMVAVVAAIVFVERGQRRIPVQYAKRQVGQKLYGGQSTHLPLKVNTSGVIPPIFASSLLMFPATMLAGYFPGVRAFTDYLHPGYAIYDVLYVALIIFFAYFYTAVTFNPVDVADNLKKFGGYVPGIRPGRATAEYIDKVLSRITFGGAIYLAVICVLPYYLIDTFKVSFVFGGTSLLIVVGVALDTVQQIEGHLITRHYEGFTGPRGPRLRGRNRVSSSPVGA
jgi:preprotein translocase subunit SecY